MEKRDAFILQLREALVNVGFLYILHPPIEPVGSGILFEIVSDASLGIGSTCEGICTEAVRTVHREEACPPNVE